MFYFYNNAQFCLFAFLLGVSSPRSGFVTRSGRTAFHCFRVFYSLEHLDPKSSLKIKTKQTSTQVSCTVDCIQLITLIFNTSWSRLWWFPGYICCMWRKWSLPHVHALLLIAGRLLKCLHSAVCTDGKSDMTWASHFGYMKVTQMFSPRELI